jgi:hypothetical protein
LVDEFPLCLQHDAGTGSEGTMIKKVDVRIELPVVSEMHRAKFRRVGKQRDD